MSELFDEVDEDVRRDQLKKLWDRYSVYIVAAALLVIAAVGGWRGYQYVEAKKAAEASVAFNKAVDLSEQNKHAEAEAAFNSLAATAPSGYRLLARLRAASEVASRDPQAAVKLYDDIAADRGVAALDQELARVRAAQLLVDTSAYPELLTRLAVRDRADRNLPSHRARIAGAVGLARQRHDVGTQMARHDRQ